MSSVRAAASAANVVVTGRSSGRIGLASATVMIVMRRLAIVVVVVVAQ